MSASNKQVIQRYFDIQNAHDLEGIFSFFSPTLVSHNVPNTDQPVGSEAIKGYFSALHEAMPNLHTALHDCIADGDRVAVRFTVTGTPTKDFMGAPAGQAVSWDIITIYRIDNGKIAEVWSN